MLAVKGMATSVEAQRQPKIANSAIAAPGAMMENLLETANLVIAVPAVKVTEARGVMIAATVMAVALRRRSARHRRRLKPRAQIQIARSRH